MGLFGGFGARLYSGQSSVDFVGRRRTWYIISAVILLVAIGALAFRGLNLGVEFKGGAVYTVPQPTCSVIEAREASGAVIGSAPTVTETGAGLLRVQTEPLDQATSLQVIDALASTCGVDQASISVQLVGPTWGQEITSKAIQALLVFLVLVMIFLSIYFEWRMAVAALVALAHDVLITIGIYALLGLEVTPATVIGILTILGYSLYDTVVVFDKVKEDTRGITAQSMLTYGEAANKAVNQVLVRSVNTSITSLLPVLAIIVVGAGLLGAGTLLDLAVALAIGMAAGTYSSIFIATPFLVQLKERQPDMKSLALRVHARRAGQARAAKGTGGGTGSEPGDDGDGDGADGPNDGGTANSGPELGETTLIAGPRSQPRRQPRSKRNGPK
jgi:preprotein translocase subunit SecF